MQYAVNKRTGCWEWQGCINNGYGVDQSATGTKKAHRIYYKKYRGKIGEGLVLDHLCRNRKCVNPDHLEAVTPAENVRRGMYVRLNKRKVIEIRRRFDLGEDVKKIASIFNISRQHVSNIGARRYWKNV